MLELLKERRPKGLKREASVLVLVLICGLLTPVVQPLWLAVDSELAVAKSTYESVSRLGVPLDPWGSPVMNPAQPYSYLNMLAGRPGGGGVSLHKPVGPGTEQASPREALTRLAARCRTNASALETSNPEGAKELLAAAEVAETNAKDAPQTLRFPRQGPYPYAFVTNYTGYYTTLLSSYSFGPNRIDERGFGDDVRMDDSGGMRDRIGIHQSAWLTPLGAGALLLLVQALSLRVPLRRSVGGELVMAVGIGAAAAVALHFALGEAIRGDPSWKRIWDACGLPGESWAEGRVKTGLPLLAGALAFMVALYLRLPHMISSERAMAREDAEREVARLEGSLGASDSQVAEALDYLANLAREEGDLEAANAASARAEKIRMALGPYLDQG